MDSFVENLLESVRDKLNLTGRQEVFENNKELLSKHIVDRGKPEEFTKNEIINKILNLLKINIGGERTFNEFLISYSMCKPLIIFKGKTGNLTCFNNFL